MIAWLGEHGVRHFVARINPAHVASIVVAERVGMTPTGLKADGETLWVSDER
jgi:RimJ/RimL family protein N-acetyltransferase